MFFRKHFATKTLHVQVANAEAAWQATEGAAMQRVIAADLLTSVSQATRQYRRSSNKPFSIMSEERELKNISLLEAAKWRRRHCVTAEEFQSFKYHTVVAFRASMLFGPIVLEIQESLAVYDLMCGVAQIRLHHPSSPYYTSGLGNWDQHKETCAFYAASEPKVEIYREKVS